MNIAELSIKYKTITLVTTLLIIGGGILSYEKLGRLEDPEFTVKNAQIFTSYPGASAREVEEEVTDEIETAIQQLGQLEMVTSTSEAGLSTVKVEIKDKYDKKTLPQVWDELRRKVGDAQSKLPPGTNTSLVYDDFGDVYGVFYAVYGDGYTYAELKKYAEMLRRELLLEQDVGKISFFGAQSEVVYVEITRARFAQLGISPEMIQATLSGQNLVVESGRVEVGSQFIRVHPTGELSSVEEIGELLILQEDGTPSRMHIKDVATITRGYADPPKVLMHFNGKPAIGLGISTVSGGNVVVMGEAVKERLRQLEAETPIGMEIGVISHQADSVTVAISNFIISLAEALAIVIGVLMLAMGLRSGILIGIILLLTVLATFILMLYYNVMLERISLGALIIALGMLVDNAIVVVEGALINMKRGMKPIEASSSIVKQTMWPLFGATVVAVLAFAAIGVSQDSTGEFCRSLFQVILFSLMLSWLLAITITPLLCVMFLKVKPPKAGEVEKDPYGGLFFSMYKGFLSLCLRFRWITVLILVGLLFLSVYGFGFVEQSFFPNSTRPQFMVHYWLPQGTHITETESDISQIERRVMEIEGVSDVSSCIGQGALRFILTFTPEISNSAYALLLVTVEDYTKIDGMMLELQDYLNANFPDAQAFSRKFVLGPGDAQKIQMRFRGPDHDVLRRLTAEAHAVLQMDPDVVDIVDDWRNRVPMIRPVLSDQQARNAGITRADVADILQIYLEGKTFGVYREGDDLLPIIGRSPEKEHASVDDMNDVQIWSPVARRAIPLSQIVLGFETKSENTLIQRRDRLPTITVKCDPRSGTAAAVRSKIAPAIEAIELPQGYTMEWGGEYENSSDAQAGIAGMLPMVFVMMVFVVVCLFNALRQPLVIFLTVPLALIGVTGGLLVFNQPFGFMALLGFLSLSGMLIKNAIVLIDEIDTQVRSGKAPYDAIVDSGMSRARPVAMAALTTVLGMIPLLADAFFVSMAVTIMCGLTFATALTLVFVPVLYALFFRIKPS